MKICIINPSVGSITGGTESFIYNLAFNLSKKHEVLIVTGKSFEKTSKESFVEAPFDIEYIPFLSRRTFKSVFSYFPFKFDLETITFYINFRLEILFNPRLINKIKTFDIISTHYYLDSILFSRYFSKFNLPCVFHIPGDVHMKHFFKFDKSSIYLSNSRTTNELVINKYDVKPDGVVTPGVSPDLFDLNREKKDNFKKKNILLYVGRLDQGKGLFKLLEIFTELCKINGNLLLIMVGEGELRKDLEKKILNKNSEVIRDKVIFTGQVFHKDIFKYYVNADILVHPTAYESFGMTVLEAMALGLPVVASDIPALREITKGTVPLLPRENLFLWVETIDILLKNETLRKEISKKEILCASEYTWDKKASEYTKYIEKIVRDD